MGGHSPPHHHHHHHHALELFHIIVIVVAFSRLISSIASIPAVVTAIQHTSCEALSLCYVCPSSFIKLARMGVA